MAKSFSERHTELQGSGGTSFTQRRSLGITPTVQTRNTTKRSPTEELYRRADANAASSYIQSYYDALGKHYDNIVANNGGKNNKRNGIYESGKVLENFQSQSGGMIDMIRRAYGNNSPLETSVRDLNQSYAQLDNAVYNNASARSRQITSSMGTNPLDAVEDRASNGDRLTIRDIEALDADISRRAGITDNAPQTEFVPNPLSGRDGVLEAARQIRMEDNRTPLDRINGVTLDTSAITGQTIPGFQTIDEQFGAGSSVSRDNGYSSPTFGISNLPLNIAESGFRSDAELNMTPAERDTAEALFSTMDKVYRNQNATRDDLQFQANIARGIAQESNNTEAIRNMANEYYTLLQDRISENAAGEYLTNRFSDAFVDWANNYQSLASLGLGDIATGGGYSEGFQKLTEYATSHPAAYRLAMQEHFGEAQNSGMRRELADSAGVSVGVVDAWLRANEATFLELRADKRASGLSDTFKKTIGDTVFHVASQIPTWALSAALGGWGGASNMPGSVVEGLATGIQNARQATSFSGAASAFGRSFGQGLVAAAKADPALWFSFGIGTMGRTASENAMRRGYDPANYLNAALMGFSEVFSENFSGFGSAKNPFSGLGTTHGSRFLTTLSAIGNYLLSGAEEGLEEVVNVPLQGFIDEMAFGGYGNHKKLLGSGGIFDFQAMWEAGTSGAVMGALLGSVGTVASIAADLSLGSKVTGSSGWLRNAATQLNEQSKGVEGLAPLNLNTVTLSDIERRTAEVTSHLIQTANETVGNSYLRNGTTEELYAMGEQLGGAVAQRVADAREAGDAVSPAIVGSIASAVRADAAAKVNEEMNRVADTDIDSMSEEDQARFLSESADRVEKYAQIVRDLDEKTRDEDERIADIYGRSMAPAAKEQMQRAWEEKRATLSEEDLKMSEAVEQDFMSIYNAAYQYGKALGDSNVGRQRLATLGDEQFLTDAYNLGVGFAERPVGGIVVERGDYDGTARNISQRELAKWSSTYDITEAGTLSERQLQEKSVMDVFAKTLGADIVMYRSLSNKAPNGFYDWETGTIYVDVNAGSGTFAKESMLRTLSHEMTHMIQQRAPKEYADLKNFIIEKYYENSQTKFDERVNEEIQASDGTLSPERAVDEVIANSCEMMLRDTDAIRQISVENKNLAQRIADFLAKFVQAIREMLNVGFKNVGISEQAAEDMEQYFGDMQKLWDAGLVAASKYVVSPYASNEEVDKLVEEEKEILPDQEMNFSRRKDSQFMDAAEDWLNKAKKAAAKGEDISVGNITAEVLATARETREKVRQFMAEHEKEMKLPLDNDGNTFITDDSYGGSEDNTSVCVRSMSMQALLNMISEEYGRPLTVPECIFVSQEMLSISIKPECVYCYVAADRQSYRGFLKQYIDQRDAALVDIANGADEETAFNTYLRGREPTDTQKWRFFRLWQHIPSGQLISASDVANFDKLEAEYMTLWEKLVSKKIKGKNKVKIETLYLDFLDRLEAGTATDEEIRYWQLYDSRSYSKSASWAKNQYGFTAYNGHILKWKEDRIKDLNSKYGLRLYSFSDYSPAFILENMQMITDAAVRGLKVLAYTKETDFAEIFAPSGAYIEISVFAHHQNGQIVADEMMGANWNKAVDLRKKYKNIGITLVATDDEIVDWGLHNPDVDVVIPYHHVRTGEEVARVFGYRDFTKESRDQTIEKGSWYDKVFGKKEGRSIHPSEHHNDIVDYVKALEEHHLKPRFERYIWGWREFLDGKIDEETFRNNEKNKVYMKLVNETRNEAEPVQPKFDYGAAERSMKYLADHGGYGVDESVRGGMETLKVEAKVIAKKMENGIDAKNHTETKETMELRGRLREGIQESSRKKTIGNTDILLALNNTKDLTSEQKKMLTLIKNDVRLVNNDRAEIDSINRRLVEIRATTREKGDLLPRAAKEMDKLMLRRIKLHDHIDTILDRIESRMNRSGLERYAKAERTKIEGMVGNNLSEAVKYLNSKYNKELADAYWAVAETKQSFAQYIMDRNEKESRESLRRTTRKLVKRLTETLTTNTDKLHVPEPLKVPVATFLAQIDPTTANPFTKKGADQIDRWQESLKAIREIAQEAVTGSFDSSLSVPLGTFSPDVADYISALESDVTRIVNSFIGNATEEERAIAAANREERAMSLVKGDRRGKAELMAEESVEYFADAYGGVQKVILEMNSVQLAHLNRVIRAIQKAVTNANRVYAQGRRMRLSDMAESSIEYLDSIGGNPFIIHGKEDKGSKFIGAANRLEQYFTWANCTPPYAFSRCGEVAEELFFSLARGQAEFAQHSKQIKDFCEDSYTPEDAKKWNERVHEFELFDAAGKIHKVKLSMWQIMSFWCHLNQADSRNYIYGEGIQIATEEGQRSDLTHYKMTPEIAGEIVSKLGPENSHERDVAKKMQEYMTKTGAAWGNKVTMAMWNYKFFPELQPYMPIILHSTDMNAIKTEDRRTSILGLLHMSATKQRTHGKNKALVLDGLDTVFNYHMADMATYTSFSLPIVDVVNWLNYKGDGTSIQASLAKAFGEVGRADKKRSVAVSYFVNLIKDLNGTTENGGQLENMTGKLLSFFKRVSVGANIRVAAQQPLSYVRAQYVIPAKYLNLAYTTKQLRNNVKEAREHSGTALWKSLGYFDTAIARPIEEQMKNEVSFSDKLVEKSMWLAEQGDAITWGALWAACKLKVQDEHKDWKSLDEQDYWDLVNHEFDRVIYFSQVMDCKLMRSEIMRGNGLYSKIHTAFMAEPTLTLNMTMDGLFRYNIDQRRGADMSKARKRLGLAIGTFAAVSILNAAVTAIFDVARDDDDYETWLEKWLDHAKDNLLENINPLKNIPLVRDILDLIKSTAKGQSYTPTEFSGIINAVKAVMIWVETVRVANGAKPTSITYYGKMGVYGKIYTTLQALSQFCGLPISNVTRELVSLYNGAITIYNSAIGRMTNEYLPHIQTYVSKTGGYDSLYQATVNGNISRANQLYQELVGNGAEDKDITSEMRKRVQEGFADGSLSEASAIRILMQFGYDMGDASSLVGKWKFQEQTGLTNASEAMSNAYSNTFKAMGVPATQFAEYWSYLHADGNDQESIRDYISSLSVPNNVKEALWHLRYSSEW